MVRRLTFAVPGDLATPTGGYAYDRRLIAELTNLGWQVDVLDLGEGFPWPSDATRMNAWVKLSDVPAGCIIVIDGLAYGVLPEAVLQLRDRVLVPLVHHPLALESGLSPQQANILRSCERAALMAARVCIVTSDATARTVHTDYAVPAERIVVARPGNDPVPQARGSRDGNVRLLSVGAVVPRKGFDVLVAALAGLADLPWRLTIAGDCTRDASCAARLDAEIARLQLADRVVVTGAVTSERLHALYMEADIFALASRFEGYGMAYSEAVAHGLPVVGTKAGATPETVPAGASVLVAPDDAGALAQVLRQLMASPADRQRMAASARAAAARLPTWQDTAMIVSRALEGLA